MSAALRLITLAAVFALAGCVTRPASAPAAAALSGPALAAATARVEAREALLAEAGGLAFGGRVALSNGSDGGSGRIEWWQRGDTFRVVLRAPVTRQGWSLSADAGGARLEGLDGGPREGPDPVALLFDATGMEVPVGALASWAAGARADAAVYGPARLEFSADGELVRMRQGGWTIDYVRWQDAAGDSGTAGTALPRRIDAERGQARVRLVVDDWSLGAAPPGGA